MKLILLYLILFVILIAGCIQQNSLISTNTSSQPNTSENNTSQPTQNQTNISHIIPNQTIQESNESTNPEQQSNCMTVYLDNYQCSGNWSQRQYQNSNCSTEWKNYTYCNYGCSNRVCQQPRVCSDGTAYGQCSSIKPEYCVNGNLIDNCSICGCSLGECQSDGTCKINNNDFKQSEVVNYTNEETGINEQYCSYDETRNKVSIIIKENGIYDNQDLIDVFNDYFSSVKNHLNIDSVGVKKFNGSTTIDFDSYIEGLVKDDFVGYVIFVGEDLPIVKPFEGELLLDYDNIDDNYSYVGRTKVTWVNECIDVATSNVIPPLNYSDQDKILFVKQAFENFVQYHSNPQTIFDNFNKTVLTIEYYDFASTPQNNSPSRFDTYNTIYFYNPVYVLDNESSRVESELRNKPLILMYNVHGSPHYLGLGLNNTTYNSNQNILDFYNSNEQTSLFVDEIAACGTMVMSANDNTFCCWPQTWLKTGNWVVTTVLADPDHYNFERWFYNEKVVGKALRKTWHNQDMIYGDILATVP